MIAEGLNVQILHDVSVEVLRAANGVALRMTSYFCFEDVS
jgi:hypothetical protein